jgi:hypothetical protein
MPILLFLNGYLTIIGLIASGVGGVMQMFGETSDLGKQVQENGLIVAGVGASRKGVKQYKGIQ